MNRMITRAAAATFAGAVVSIGAVATPANAAPNQQQDGLINVAVGDVNLLNDVNIGVAANVAATICGVKVGPVAVGGQAVDASGASTTVCTTSGTQPVDPELSAST